MNVDKIIDAVGNINDEYIEDAALSGKKVSFARYGWIAAAIAVVFALVFFQTPPGVAAFSAIKENVIEIVERLFPPKDVTVYVEGESEIVSHISAVQEVSTAENGSHSAPGFVIYYDPEIYTEIKENDVTYINYIPLQEEIGLDMTQDTYDAGLHLNTQGAEKMSDYFGAWLVENYDLTDYRTDETYAEIWQEKVDFYNEMKEQQYYELETYGELVSFGANAIQD